MGLSLWKLRLSMWGTLALTIALSTLALSIILSLIGALNVTILAFTIGVFYLAQWLLAPYLIEAVYKVREADLNTYGWLHEIVSRISKKSGIKKPKVMIAHVPIPNAFAYGSPLTGNRVAVTEGLLNTLNKEEIEAVLGHEIGHLVHKDVYIMMIISFLPALLYIIGRALLFSSWFAGYGSREEENEAGLLALIGMGAIAFHFLLQLFVLGLSRLREYYADRHSATIVDNGARKLQLALAKITVASRSLAERGVNLHAFNDFRSLFIQDPSSSLSEETLALYGDRWEIVERLKRRKLTLWDRVMEIFSTHPNLIKRLRALDELAKGP